MLDTCRYGNQIDVTFIQRIIIIPQIFNNNIDINSVEYVNRGYYCTLSSMFGILKIRRFFIWRSHTFLIKLAAEGSKTLIKRRFFIILSDTLLSRFYELSEEKLNLQCRCRYGANRKPS